MDDFNGPLSETLFMETRLALTFRIIFIYLFSDIPLFRFGFFSYICPLIVLIDVQGPAVRKPNFLLSKQFLDSLFINFEIFLQKSCLDRQEITSLTF
jgi:hypothetical protein